MGGIGLEGLDGPGRIVQHHIAPAVGDHGIGAAVGEGTVVDEGTVGLAHLPHGDAVGELSQCHGGIADVVRHQAGDAEPLGQIVVGGLGPAGKNVHDLGRYGVQRPHHALLDGDDAVVLVAVVMGIPAGAPQADVGGIVHDGAGGDEPQVHRRAVGGDGLEGGAGRTLCAAVVKAIDRLRDRPVQREVLGLLPYAAAQGHDAPVIGIHNDDGALELLVGPVAGAGDLVQVGVDRVHDLLDSGVLEAVDLIAAVIQQRGGRLPADALGLHQVVDHVVDDHFLVVAVNRLGPLLVRGMGEDQLLGHGGLVGVVVDVFLLVHLPQDGLLPLFIVLLVVEGVIVGGLVGDAHDGGALRQAQLRHVLAEVGVGGGLHAVAALSEVDGVEIPFHDLFLVVLLLQLQGAEDLRQFSLDGDLVVAGQVLDELLGNGGAAVAGLHLGEHLDKRGGGTEPVHAVVLVEALILDGHQGLFHIGRDVLIIHPDPLVPPHQVHQLFPVPVLVLDPDGAGFAELEILQGNVHIGRQAVFDIVGENAGEEQPGYQQHQQHRAHDLPYGAYHRCGGVCGKAHGLQGHAPRIDLLLSFILRILLHRNRNTSFPVKPVSPTAKTGMFKAKMKRVYPGYFTLRVIIPQLVNVGCRKCEFSQKLRFCLGLCNLYIFPITRKNIPVGRKEAKSCA